MPTVLPPSGGAENPMNPMSSRAALLPGPRGVLPGRALVALRRHPETFLRLARRYGDVVSFRVGTRQVLLLSDPLQVQSILETHASSFRKGWGPQPGGAIGGGLVGNDGELHRRHRDAMTSLFHGGRFPAYGREVVSLTESMVEGWSPGRAIDLWAEMKGLTSRFVTRALLGVDEQRRQLLCEASELVTRQFSPFMSGWAGIARRLDPRRRSLARALRRVDASILALIEERRREASEGQDLVATLLRQGGLDDQEIKDEVVTLFVAGFETIALALTWSWLLVARHPAVGERLRAEVDGTAGDERLGSGHLARLPYVRAVLAESLRLFPPKWMLGRLATERVELEGLTVAPGTLVLISPYVVHRDARHFPEPEQFRPERWLDRTSQAVPRSAYLPFGAGPRRCIGEGLAWLEGTLAMATIARGWQLEPVSDRVRLDPRVTLRPKGGLTVRPRRRSPGSQ